MKQLYSAAEIATAVERLAAEIDKDFGAEEDLVLLGVLTGSFLFMADLARKVRTPCAIDFLRLSSYADATSSSGEVTRTLDSKLDLAGKTVAYVGDYNNVARSLGEISALLGMHVRYGCPTGFAADEAELDRILLLGAASVAQTARPTDAVTGAHAVHTDTWVSILNW